MQPIQQPMLLNRLFNILNLYLNILNQVRN